MTLGVPTLKLKSCYVGEIFLKSLTYIGWVFTPYLIRMKQWWKHEEKQSTLFLQSDHPLFASGCVRWTVHSQSSIAWIFSHRCVPITQFARCFSGPNLLEFFGPDGYGSKSLKSQLVGGIPTPLKNMSSSIGMMTFPIYGKIIQSCSSHHQPDKLY